jgi:UPF0042 nucleotide-binding protein
LKAKVKNLIVITGLSGAGISSAARAVEDANIQVVSNPPASLLVDVFNAPSIQIKDFLCLTIQLNSKNDTQGIIQFLKHVKVASPKTKVEVWYLNASNEVILNRFRRQRRPHLIKNEDGVEENAIGIESSIDEQRKLGSKVFDLATWEIDTSQTSENDLRQMITQKVNFINEKKQTFDISIASFGIEKDRQVPLDFLFNCRDLPNPYWEEELKKKNGLDAVVKEYVLNNATSKQFLDNIEEVIWNGISLALHSNRAGIAIGFGCTGGQHRSVCVSEEMVDRIKNSSRLDKIPNIQFNVFVSHLARSSWNN